MSWTLVLSIARQIPKSAWQDTGQNGRHADALLMPSLAHSSRPRVIAIAASNQILLHRIGATHCIRRNKRELRHELVRGPRNAQGTGKQGQGRRAFAAGTVAHSQVAGAS